MPIKNRQQLLLIAAIACVALLAGDKLLYTPLSNAWAHRQERLAKLRHDIDTGNLLKRRDAAIHEAWNDLARRALTNDVSAAEQQVYKAIDSWAQETGVAVVAITPEYKRDSDEYTTYGCRIDATGDINQLAQFLHKAEREPLAFKFEQIELAARDKEGQQLSLGLQFSALVLNPPAK